MAGKIEVGSKLGPYTIKDVLGRGSQGIVYLATAEGREPAAIKALRPDADENARARFQREAATAKSLEHEGIVRVFEHGQEPDGVLWFAMERIDFANLDRRIATLGPLEPREAARLVATLARAVHYAHEKGVIHRDLKPSNILLAHGSIYRPKIADFGLALVPGGGKLTQTNAFVGTPCYLAPEVIQGEKATRSSDIYALGAILYECLVGRAPFLAPNIGAILDKALRETPMPPRRIKPNVPAPLERICFQCLEKTPGHRPPSAASVATALERFLGAPAQPRKLEERALEGLALVRATFVKFANFALGAAVGFELGFYVGMLMQRRP
ncbi:MAG TPA: serine/threonine-protein kinase [Planctomycetota bacterium]|nr:serine/threonine-protein kinase [Planctomycetota bacterium]